jgi:hypothetical protein
VFFSGQSANFAGKSMKHTPYPYPKMQDCMWLLLCIGSAGYLVWATFNHWIESYVDF